ncbi:MAG: hypothetical protein OEW29_02300 [Acidimicrobiia bacterium]|nr:hypothetical protein [Acidimicrobiia bacterium]
MTTAQPLEAPGAPTRRGRRPRFRLVSLFAVLALAFTGLAAGPANAAPSAPPALSFTATVAGSVTATGPGTFSLSGAGVASVIGAAQYSGTVVVTSVAQDGSLTDTLTETYTAPNGDTLTIECRQSAVPIDSGVLMGTDSWTVTGGTGRFAHASGSGTGTTYVYNLQTFVKKSTGSITL